MYNKLTHRNLADLANHLGYKMAEGLCQGFTMMLCQAWLSEDEKTFFERLHLIASFEKDFKKLKQAIEYARAQVKDKNFGVLSQETKLLLEIPAFFEGIELYLRPNKYSDLFLKFLTQNDVESLYSMRARKSWNRKNCLSILTSPMHLTKMSCKPISRT